MKISNSELYAMDRAALRNLMIAGDTSIARTVGPQLPAFGNTAFIPIIGPICKYPSSGDDDCGVSTLAIQQQISEAMADPSIQSITLFIDSPGGTVAGTSDLADYIGGAIKTKPITAYISDNCQSAAYWLASRCSKIVANAGASVGSIGVYQILEDSSAAAKSQGLTFYLVSDGEYKGQGAPGLPIDDKTIAEAQKRVGAATTQFVASIATGRRMSASAAKALADGRVYGAVEAMSLGLIDQIGTLDLASGSITPAVRTGAANQYAALASGVAQLAAMIARIPARAVAPRAETAAAKTVREDRRRMVEIAQAVGPAYGAYAIRAFQAGLNATEAVAHHPDLCWERNIGNVQASYSGNKTYFVADLKHKAEKLAEEVQRDRRRRNV